MTDLKRHINCYINISGIIICTFTNTYFKGKGKGRTVKMDYLLLWIASHTLIVCLIAGTIVSAIWISLFHEKLKINIWVAPILAVANTIAGLISVKLFAGLEAWGNPLSNGQSLFGSVFLLPLFYFAGTKITGRKYADVFDVFLMCTITTLIFARVDCIMSGCCYGKYIPGSEMVRWPTREMEIVFHIILLTIFYLMNKKNKLPGATWPLYMVSYGAFRFIEEWLRVGDSVIWVFHRGHLWALLSVIIGSSVYLELRTKAEHKKEYIR